MRFHLTLFVLGSVHLYRLNAISDRPEELSIDLIQNETKLPVENNNSSSNITSTILKTDDVKFPYMVAILHTSNILIGSGAIVGEKWVLVTGFQLGAFQPDQLIVRVGSNIALSGGVLVAVDKLYSHPMHHQFNNDVALVKTAGSLAQNATVQIISIATNTPSLGMEADFILWDKESQVFSSEADIVPVSECKMFYPDFELTESNICIVTDQILPYSVALFGSPLVMNRSLLGLYMGMETNAHKPYLCTNLAPLNQWVQMMMLNETETKNLFPIT